MSQYSGNCRDLTNSGPGINIGSQRRVSRIRCHQNSSPLFKSFVVFFFVSKRPTEFADRVKRGDPLSGNPVFLILRQVDGEDNPWKSWRSRTNHEPFVKSYNSRNSRRGSEKCVAQRTLTVVPSDAKPIGWT